MAKTSDFEHVPVVADPITEWPCLGVSATNSVADLVEHPFEPTVFFASGRLDTGEHFRSGHDFRASGGRFGLPSRFPLRISSERNCDCECDDEYAGTDRSKYLLVVVTGSVRQKPSRSEQRSVSDCYRPDYRFGHTDNERLERERKDGQRHTDRRTDRSERPVGS